MRFEVQNVLKNTPFVLRLAFFFWASLTISANHGLVPIACVVLIFFFWILDLVAKLTIWFTTSIRTYLIQFGFLLVFALCLVARLFSNDPSGGLHQDFSILLLLLAFNSDAISNSRRWVILLPSSGLALALLVILSRYHTYPETAWVYVLVPAAACLARVFFPRTKDLIHTSLDYPPLRVEILSYGLKRPAAAGIKLSKR